MSTEQKYRELTPGDVIQPGDEWMDFQGNWHRGMTNSMGENYRPEPDGRGMTYHCRHRRPLTDWESLYREEVAAKDQWKQKYQKLCETMNEFGLASAKNAAENAAEKDARIADFEQWAEWVNNTLDTAGAPPRDTPQRRILAMRDEIKQLTADRDEWKQVAEGNLLGTTGEVKRLELQLALAREMLEGQEKRHKEEIAKLNANYLKVMVERDQMRAMTTPPRELWMPKPPQSLCEDIVHAINCRSAENGSNTPDWILGDFLMASLEAFDAATKARRSYYQTPNDTPAGEPPTTTAG